MSCKIDKYTTGVLLDNLVSFLTEGLAGLSKKDRAMVIRKNGKFILAGIVRYHKENYSYEISLDEDDLKDVKLIIPVEENGVAHKLISIAARVLGGIGDDSISKTIKIAEIVRESLESGPIEIDSDNAIAISDGKDISIIPKGNKKKEIKDDASIEQ